MASSHTVADRDTALRVAQVTVPDGYVVGVGLLFMAGRVWVRIDDAPFPAFLPWRIVRFGNSLSYSLGSDTLTYPPTVAAVVQSVRAALAAVGIEGVDISLSHAAAKRQAAQILALNDSAHGRMRLARLLAAAGLDEEAIVEQLDWLERTS